MLKERDRDILDFERSWWKYPGPKDRAIREYVGMSATRYYQALRRLMDDPAALEHDPLTVRRLRRTRADARKRALERRLGDGE
jgi:hypothetical protein